MPMPILRVGLIVGSVLFLYVTWASMGAGFPVEVAIVRGMVAFMALSFVAYIGELVVATAPRPEVEAAAEPAADADEDAGSEPVAIRANESDNERGEQPAVPVRAALPPISIRDDNDEQQAA